MTYLIDTSVLVAALVEAHPQHARARRWISRIRRGEIEGVVSSHTLAETYAVLTRLPCAPRITPRMAWRLIQENTKDARVVSLSAGEYRRTLARLAERGLGGGVVYDALIAAAAQKLEVDGLVTFNVGDFQRVWPEAGDRILLP